MWVSVLGFLFGGSFFFILLEFVIVRFCFVSGMIFDMINLEIVFVEDIRRNDI